MYLKIILTVIIGLLIFLVSEIIKIRKMLDKKTTFIVPLRHNKADDELYEMAKQLVLESDNATSSFLQRKLSIGYTRAMGLLQILEDEDVITAPDKQNNRKVKK